MAAALGHPIRETERHNTDPEDERASLAASQTSTLDTFASSTQSQMSALRDDTVASSQSSLGPDDGEAMEVDALGEAQGNPLNGGRRANTSPGLAQLQTQSVGKLVNGTSGAGVTALSNGDTRQGQKRTASGQVKTPNVYVTSNTVDGGPEKGHKRTTSVNPQVTELSAQLRARLSYAMIKVQNGWESHNLDEVEVLASQQGSPMSLTSPWRSGHSPLKPSSPSEERSYGSAAMTQASRVLNGTLHRDASTRLSSTPRPANGYIPSSSAPALAPPVDFGAPSHPRRTSVASRPPPRLGNGAAANGSSNLRVSTASSGALVSSIPVTPPLHDTSSMNLNLQTPSQRATASERDAIETLLFMSSPGNSQTFRPTASSQPVQHSPPRSAMSASPQRLQQGQRYLTKQVAFQPMTQPTAMAMEAVDRVPLSPRKRELLDGARLEDEASIDRVLDQMPVDGEGDSSSDESLGSVAPPPPERTERSVLV